MIRNKGAMICIVFTLLTLTASILNLFQGVGVSSNLHILMRFSITVLAIGSLSIFERLKGRPLYQVQSIHYLVTMGLILVGTWFLGRFVSLHPNAYRDIFLNYTLIYILITIIEIPVLQLIRRRKQMVAKEGDQNI